MNNLDSLFFKFPDCFKNSVLFFNFPISISKLQQDKRSETWESKQCVFKEEPEGNSTSDKEVYDLLRENDNYRLRIAFLEKDKNTFRELVGQIDSKFDKLAMSRGQVHWHMLLQTFDT